MKILIVDEDVISAKGLAYLLKSNISECNISVARSCAQAISLFHTENFNFIILDLMLPLGETNIFSIVREDFLFGVDLLFYFCSKKTIAHIIGYSATYRNDIEKIFYDQGASYVSKNSFDARDELIRILLPS